jgi:4-hydroxybenzoate polyprenyltransferase
MDSTTTSAQASTGAVSGNVLTVHLDGQLLRHGLKGERTAACLKSLSFITRRPTHLDVTVLPYDEGTLARTRAFRAAGGRTELAASFNDDTVKEVARHLGCFDSIVPAGPAVPASTRESQGTVREWLRALRIHQWVKNALIFVPLLAAHQFHNPAMLIQAVIAVIAFGLCASSVYVLNDILDLADDRHHRQKRFRPFAAGTLPIGSGLVAFPLLLALSFTIALATLPPLFSAVLAAYYTLTLTYSMALKRVMALDVIALAMLYTLRIFAGVAALSLTLTFWLLAFAMFLFLSLALAKRYAEVRDALERGRPGKTRGRDYDTTDLEMISSLGAASGYLAVLVLALYIREQSTVALYSNPEVLWLACPVLLFWITRVWMLTHRGQMHEDPVVFAARDWVSQAAGVIFLLTFLAAS